MDSNEKSYYLRSLDIRRHYEKFSDSNGKDFKLNFVLSYIEFCITVRSLIKSRGIKTNKIRFV